MKFLICVLCAWITGATQLCITCDMELIAFVHKSVLLSLSSILSVMGHFQQYFNYLCQELPLF